MDLGCLGFRLSGFSSDLGFGLRGLDAGFELKVTWLEVVDYA